MHPTTQCICVFRMELRTNSDYFPTKHYLICFYNKDTSCLQQWYELSLNMTQVKFHPQVFNQNSFSRFGNTTCGRADRHSYFFYLDFIWGEKNSRQSQLHARNFYLMSNCNSSNVAFIRYSLWTEVCDLRSALFCDSTLRKISKQRTSRLHERRKPEIT